MLIPNVVTFSNCGMHYNSNVNPKNYTELIIQTRSCFGVEFNESVMLSIHLYIYIGTRRFAAMPHGIAMVPRVCNNVLILICLNFELVPWLTLSVHAHVFVLAIEIYYNFREFLQNSSCRIHSVRTWRGTHFPGTLAVFVCRARWNYFIPDQVSRNVTLHLYRL